MTTIIENGHATVEILNATPHPIRFKTILGNVEVAPSGYTLLATPKEKVVDTPYGGSFSLVTTVFVPSEKGTAELAEIREKHPYAVIVGSLVSAQAYPGQVYGIIPAPGFERAAPADKLYLSDKFNVFFF
jgi:hypothetical protein